ncbi:hypothetical protein F5Y18DRAFT_420496 [Xylariaceae sp. FL1019]|nr:hypothetical protein F5Y18DRAFT_420496 [Xylariaceae sp. FL1019]
MCALGSRRKKQREREERDRAQRIFLSHTASLPPSPATRIARSTPASQRRLRRTPNFSASPSPRQDQQKEIQPQSRQSPPRVTVTLGPTGRYTLAEENVGRIGLTSRPRATRQLSQGHLTTSSAATSPQSSSPQHIASHSGSDPNRPEPHPVVRISKHTHSAVLYALEATLRGPNTLSADPVEEYAQMADLRGGRGPATSNGNGAASIHAEAGRAAVGSPSGIRGPKAIMAERVEREARRAAEKKVQDALMREHLENEARKKEDAERREAERRAAREQAERRAAGAVQGMHMANTADPSSSRRQQQPIPSRPTMESSSRPAVPGSNFPSNMHPQTSMRNDMRNEQPTARPTQAAASAAPTAQPQPQGNEYSNALGRGRNSFPHAFERWETLSAHWEGLTSFWIRRLEQNATEIQNDQIAQQLSRQVTDLSSAGANLFHAVVELQRLRASSERKFQRWFYETRADLERMHEVTGVLEATLEEERRSKEDAIQKSVTEALETQRVSAKSDRRLKEMQKELIISKEEARRAWEELGRREQEERDRTASLQQGQPTIVGGVQVVPMGQGVGNRTNTQSDRYGQGDASEYNSPPTPRATRADSHAPAVQPVATTTSSANPAMQTPSSVHHQPSYGSEGTFSEGEYIAAAYQDFVREAQGQGMNFATQYQSQEFETPATQPSVYHPPVPVPQPPQFGESEADYSGSGYSAPGWEEMQPRHHHPTRLSDVLEEEEERSRTSASQVSRH